MTRQLVANYNLKRNNDDTSYPVVYLSCTLPTRAQIQREANDFTERSL